MPDRPRPADVRFDDVAAAAAIAELAAARRVLGETQGVRATATRTANGDFRGGYAQSFADASTELDQEATAAAEGLDTLRQAIENVVEEVRRRRRDIAAAQAAWDAEAAAERRLHQRYM